VSSNAGTPAQATADDESGPRTSKCAISRGFPGATFCTKKSGGTGDVWSRKIVGWRIADADSAEIASELITLAATSESVQVF